MRRGSSPKDASRIAINRIVKYYPDFSGAVIVVNKNGEYATACSGMSSFPYISVINGNITLSKDGCVNETTAGSFQPTIAFQFVLVMFFTSLFC